MDQQEKELGQTQIAESKGILTKLVRNTYEEILNVKSKNEQFQKKSRLDEESRRLGRYEDIQYEAVQAQKQNGQLEIKWSDLKEMEECEELNRQIDQQKDLFKDIVNKKDALIGDFEKELKKKEDDYVKMLKEQAEDIKKMIVYMRSQFFEVRDGNLCEMNKIETQFDKERRMKMNEYQTVIKEIFHKHEQFQKEWIEDNATKDDQNYRSIEKYRTQGAKAFADLKLTMETEIQNLENCHEDMKALYQLNTEKLDYNLKVLLEKNAENCCLSGDLNRKDNILQSRFRNSDREYKDFDTSAKIQNRKLSQRYKRITTQFKELQRKFKHFQKADMERLSEIMKMNEAEVCQYKEKLIKCDKTIHIQQLGVHWEEKKEDIQAEEEKQAALQVTNQFEEKELVEFIVGEEKLREVMEIVLGEAEFLLDDKLCELLHTYELEEQISQKLDIMQKCIGIDSKEEFDMFLEQLIKRCRQQTQEELDEEFRIKQEKLMLEREEQRRVQFEEENKEQQAQGQPPKEQTQPEVKDKDSKKKKKEKLLEEAQKKEEEDEKKEEVQIDLNTTKININEVMPFLIEWMNSKEERKKILEQMTKNQKNNQETEREKKNRMAKDQQRYWDKLTQVLPEKTFRVWKVLDQALTKYYQLLVDRQKLIDETGELHNQNEELKNLLNQYLQINHELIIPPTRLINLEPNQ